jgi:hypothetical protein
LVVVVAIAWSCFGREAKVTVCAILGLLWALHCCRGQAKCAVGEMLIWDEHGSSARPRSAEAGPGVEIGN